MNPKTQSHRVLHHLSGLIGKLTFVLILPIVLLVGALVTLVGVSPVQAAGGILIGKVVSSGTVTAGEPFTYTINVTNTSAFQVVASITDTLPAGMSVVDAGTGVVGSGAIVWADETIGPSASRSFSFSVQVTQAGDVVNDTYLVKSGVNVTNGTPVTTTIVAGPPAQVNISASPNPNTAGVTTAITTTLADQYGNTIHTQTPLTLTFTAGALNGDASGTVVTQTDTSGYFVGALNAITQPGTVRVRAFAGGFSDFVDVQYTHGPPASLVVSVAPTTIPAPPGGQSAQIIATVKDSYGNPDTSDTVSFQSSLGILDITNGGALNTLGKAYASLLGSTVAGTASLTITVGSLTDTSHTVYLTPGPADQIFISASPLTIPVSASGTSNAAISATVKDQYGNLVEPTAISFTTSLGTLTGGGTTDTTTTVNGQASSTLKAGTTAGYAQVTAHVNGLQKVQAVYFQPDSPANVSLVAIPSTIDADGVSTAILSATVTDQFGNPVDVPNDVTFAAGYGTLAQSIVTTQNGVATTTLRSSTDLVTNPVTATATGIITPATTSVEFVVGAPVAADISLSPTAPITVGVPTTMTVVSRDSVGHAVPNVPLTVTTSLGWLTPNSGTTDGSGQIQFTLESTRTGTANFSAVTTGGGLAVQGTSSANFIPDVSAEMVLTASVLSLYANGTNYTTIQGTLLDRFGNLTNEAGVIPVFTTTHGTLNAPAATDTNGQVNRILTTDTSLGDAVVSVTSLVTPTQITISFTTGPVANANLTATPNNPTAGDAINLAITATDSVGHLLPNQVFTVTRTLGSNPLACSPSDGAGVIACNGVVFTQTTYPKIYVNGIQATGDTITVLPAALDHVEITPFGASQATPIDLPAAQPYTFTATVYDIYGNIRPDSVVWDPPIGNGGTGSVVDGVFTGQKAGLVFLQAHAANEYGFTWIKVRPGLPARARVTPNPTTVPADDATTSELTIQIMDAYDNPVGEGVYVSVLSTLGTVEGTAPTNASGIATRTIRSGAIGTATISVSSGPPLTITPDSTPTVNFVPGFPAKAQITATTIAPNFEWNGSTLKIHANGVDTATLRITILDAQGNPVTAGYPVTVSASPPTISGSGQTDANGIITRTIAAPLLAQPALITVTYLTDLPLLGHSVEYFVGPLETVSISPSGPYTVTAGQPTDFTAFGYDIAGAEVQPPSLTYVWSVQNSGTGDGAIVGGNTSQVATFSGSTVGSGLQLSVLAHDGVKTKVGRINLTVIPAPPATATVSITPSAVLADGATPFTVTLQNLTDQYGNAARDGEMITATINSVPPSSATGVLSGGQMVFSATSTTVAGTFTVTAESAAGMMDILGTNSITFLPGAPARAEVLSATPAQIVADGVSTATITLQLQDTFGNPVGLGFTPTITATGGTILTPAAPTDASGTVTHTLQSDLTVGAVTLYLGGFPATGVPVSFIPGPPATAAVTATATALTVGGNSAQLVFDVRDAWGHSVGSSVPITPTITPSLGWWTGGNSPIGGLVTKTLFAGNTAGSAVVSSPGITVTGDITFTFLPDVPAQALITASTSPITVGNTITLTGIFSDSYGNAAYGESISLTAVLGLFNGTSQTTTLTTDGAGTVQIPFYSENAGLEYLTLSGRGGSIAINAGSDDIIFTPDVPQTVAITPAGPLTVRANIPQTFTVSSLDRFGNPVDSWTPVDYLWHQTSANNAAGYGTLTANDSHARSVTFNPQKTGGNELYATGGVQESNHVLLTVSPGYPAAATVSVSPAILPADGTSQFTVTVTNLTDASGNPIPAGTVLTVTVPSVPQIVAGGIYTAGQFQAVMTANTHAGTFPLSIKGEGNLLSTLTGDTSVTFLPGDPARAVITASPTQITADGSSTANIIVTVTDANFNPVVDGTSITLTTSLGTVSGTGDTVNGKVNRTLTSEPTLGTATFAVTAPNGSLFISGDTVDFIVGAAAQAELSATPADVVADGVSTSQLVFTVKDSAGFDVGGSGTAIISTDHGAVVPNNVVAANGVFTVSFTSDISISTVGIDVTYDGVPLAQTGDTLRQVAGIPTTATISSTVSTLHAGEPEQADLTVSIVDARGRPIMDGSVVTVTTNIGAIVSNTTTSASGQVARVLTPGGTVGTVAFTVTVQTPWGTVVTLTPVADPVQIVAGSLAQIVVHPTSPLDVTAGDGVTLIAVGYDAFGNDTGQRNFSWRYWSGSCPANLNYCVSQPGNGDGVLSGTVVSTAPTVFSAPIFTGTTAGLVGIKAYTGTIFSSMLNVTVHPGAPATATVKATPKTIRVGGDTSELVITIRDAFNNLVDSPSVRIVTDLDTIVGSGAVVNGVTTRTLVSGKFFGTVNVYVEDFEAGGDKVLIAPRAIVSPNPNTLLADGSSTSELTIQVFDQSGKLVPDGTVPVITSTLGSISGSGGTVGGIFTRTLTADFNVGTAEFYVDGNQAQGVVTFTVGPPTRVQVNAVPNFLPADGSSKATLTFSVEDDYGHTISSFTNPLTITASAGTLSSALPTVAGVTTRVLTASATPGKAEITVENWPIYGDTDIFFLQGGLKDGDFESGTFNDWAARNITTPTPQFSWWGADLPSYQVAITSGDVVGGKVITPYSGTKMVRLGATVDALCSSANLPGYPVVGAGYHSYEYPNNCPHQLSEAWVSQSFYVPADGVSQVQYRYRIVGYDVAVSESGKEWDPFEVYRNGLEITPNQDGVPYTFDWYYGWYTQNPSTPIDAHPEDENGWHFGYFDVTAFKGQVVNIEFRMSNRTAPMDNTWAYLDAVKLVNVIPGQTTTYDVFLPLVMK